jgi:hypothetical protein
VELEKKAAELNKLLTTIAMPKQQPDTNKGNSREIPSKIVKNLEDGPSESQTTNKFHQAQIHFENDKNTIKSTNCQYQSPKFFIASPKPSQGSPAANDEDHFSF